MHALQRHFAFLRLFDPALQCQLCGTLMSPLLRYASDHLVTL